MNLFFITPQGQVTLEDTGTPLSLGSFLNVVLDSQGNLNTEILKLNPLLRNTQGNTINVRHPLPPSEFRKEEVGRCPLTGSLVPSDQMYMRGGSVYYNLNVGGDNFAVGVMSPDPCQVEVMNSSHELQARSRVKVRNFIQSVREKHPTHINKLSDLAALIKTPFTGPQVFHGPLKMDLGIEAHYQHIEATEKHHFEYENVVLYKNRKAFMLLKGVSHESKDYVTAFCRVVLDKEIYTNFFEEPTEYQLHDIDMTVELSEDDACYGLGLWKI